MLAEFLRLYHSGEKVVAEATANLLHVPFVETFGDEVFGVGYVRHLGGAVELPGVNRACSRGQRRAR